MDYILSCLEIFFKWLIGGFIWIVFFFLLSIPIDLLRKKRPKKPKYKGEPIVIRGGKSSAKDAK